MRINGMVSGMDIDSIVQDMLKVDELKVKKVEREKQALEWKQEVYTDLNKDLANFLVDSRKDLGLMTTTSTGTNINTGMSNISWHMSATSSDESIGTASASGANAFTGEHEIEVVSLAKRASLTSTADIASDLKVGADNSFTFKVNGEEISMEEGDDVADFARKINSSAAGVKASYDADLGRLFLQSDKTGSDARIDITDVGANGTGFIDQLNIGDISPEFGEISSRSSFESSEAIDPALTAGGAFSFTLNGESISVAQDDTVEMIKDKMNAITGITADYTDGILTLNSDDGSQINISDITNSSGADTSGIDFMSALNLGPVNLQSLDIDANAGSTSGEDGLVRYNGIDKDIDSNNFSVNGVDFNVRAEGTFTVNVDADVNAAVDKIKGFIDKYNEMIDKAGGLLAERPDRGYGGITDEEREAMTEDELEKWEGLAKKGALHRDSTLSEMLSGMRSSLYENLSEPGGSFDHLTEIGITTQKYSSGQTGGKLEINEDKLRQALSDDANGVMSLLFQNGEVDESGTARTDSRGIFNRVSDHMIDGMKELIDKSGTGGEEQLFRKVRSNMLTDFIVGTSPLVRQGSLSMMDSNMLDLDSELSELNDWLVDKENSYYDRFTAMEKAMQEMSSQSQWLMSQQGMQY